MPRRPLVSIVTPTYNRKAMLAECIKSIRAQALSDWEMVICDDGGTDGTEAMVAAIGDSRIRVIRCKPSGGLCAVPRNQAIRESRGRFIVPVDDDDMLPPDSLAMRVAAYRIGASGGEWFICGPGYVVGHEAEYDSTMEAMRAGTLKVNFVRTVAWTRQWEGIHGGTVLAPRELFERHGLYDEHPDLRCGQDRELWQRWVSRGALPIHVNEPVTFNRWHVKNMQTLQSSGEIMCKKAYLARALATRRDDLSTMPVSFLSPSPSDGFIFWVSVDLCVEHYLEKNSCLRQLADAHRVLLVATTGYSGRAAELCPGADVIECPNNLQAKGNVALDYAASTTFDYLVRLDADALVFDAERLMEIVRESISSDRMEACGMIEEHPGVAPFLWGSCNATSRALANRIRVPVQWVNPHEFDTLYTGAIRRVGGRLIEANVLERTEEYLGTAPVWHPSVRNNLDLSGEARMEQFTRNAERFVCPMTI